MPVLRDLIMKSQEIYRSLSAMDDMEFGYEERGILHLFNTEEGLEEGRHEAEVLGAIDIETMVIGKEEVVDRLGGLNATVVGAVYYPQDAHLTPARFVRALAARFQAMGGTVLAPAEVRGFEKDGRRIVGVNTSAGTIEADEVVLASGSWTPLLARELGIKAPIQAAKGYSVTFRRPDGIPEVPFICGESRVAVTPMGDTIRFAGTLELAGIDLSINQRRVDAILRAPAAYVSEVDATDMERLEVWGWTPPAHARRPGAPGAVASLRQSDAGGGPLDDRHVVRSRQRQARHPDHHRRGAVHGHVADGPCPLRLGRRRSLGWIPAFAGMTDSGSSVDGHHRLGQGEAG